MLPQDWGPPIAFGKEAFPFVFILILSGYNPPAENKIKIKRDWEEECPFGQDGAPNRTDAP